MYQLPVAVCSSFGAANDGQQVSDCPAGDLVIHYVEVPEFTDYAAAFIELDPDIPATMFGATLTLFVTGLGIGLVLKVLRMRTRPL